MKRIVNKYPLISYFFLSFILMWSLASLTVFGLKLSDYPFLFVVGAWTPTIAAIIIGYCVFGSISVKALLKGWTIWKVHFAYYLIAFIPLFISLFMGLVYSLFVKKAFDPIASNLSFLQFFELIVFSILLGPTGEQAGWRGFALRLLQRRFNAILSTLILGFIWAIWHLPLFFMPDWPGSQVPFLIYILHTIAQSFFLTWIFNSTKGSLLLAGILHLSHNITSTLLFGFNLMPKDIGYFSILLIDIVIAVLLLIFWGKRNLSKNWQKVVDFK